MNNVIIASEQCKGCRLCAEMCPKKCIVIGDDINKMGYLFAEFKPGPCTACGICYYVCPEINVITVNCDEAAASHA